MIIKAGTYRFNDVLNTPENDLHYCSTGTTTASTTAEVFCSLYIPIESLTVDCNGIGVLAPNETNEYLTVGCYCIYNGSANSAIITNQNNGVTSAEAFLIFDNDYETNEDFGTWFTSNTQMLIKAGTYRWNDVLIYSGDLEASINFTFNGGLAGSSPEDAYFDPTIVNTATVIRFVDPAYLYYGDGTTFPYHSESYGWDNIYQVYLLSNIDFPEIKGLGQIITVTADQYVPTNFGLWAVENWQGPIFFATILAGQYRLKLQPTMPDEVIYSLGGSSGVEISPEGIYTLSESEGETTKKMLYDANLKVWSDASARYIKLEENQDVNDKFAEWFYANIVTEPTTYSNFYIKDKIFKFTDNINWVAWFNSLFYDKDVYITANDYVIYNEFLLSYNNTEVSAYDKIIKGASYGIFPQIRVNVVPSIQVEINPLFSPVIDSYHFLLPNHTYTVNVKVDKNYTLKSCIIENLPYDVSLTADVQDNQIIINVGNIPDNFEDFDVIRITPEFERKIFTPLDTQNVTINGIQTREMLPQYRMDIDGYYYIPKRNHGLSQISASFENAFVFAVSSSSISLGQGAVEENSLLNIDSLLSILGFDITGAQIPDRVYITDNWLVEYLNNEITPSELVGLPIMVADYDLDLFVETFINRVAQDSSITYEEALAQITEEATANNLSVKDYVLAYIQAELGDLSRVRVYRSVVTAEADVTSLTENLANSNVYSYEALGIASVLAFYTASRVLKNSYTFTFTTISGYDLYKNSSSEEEITTDYVFSSENDFNITAHGYKPDGFYYLTVDSQVLPTDRFTAGVAYTSLQTCLSGDTLISMADGLKKRIDQIKVGDIVTTVYGNEKVIFTDALSHKVKDKYIVYYFSDGIKLTIIKDHRVYSSKHKRYVHISSLINGDKVVLENGKQIELLYKKVYCNKEICHYTLYTENCNGYYANGVLCGNIFANIKPKWARKLILNLYYKLVLRKELKFYDEFNG